MQVTLSTIAGTAVYEQAAVVIQQHLKQVELDVKIDARPPAIFFRFVGRRETAMAMFAMFAWIGSPIISFRSIWHSAEIPISANGFVGNNVTGYRNVEVDQLLDAAERELDQG